MNADNAVEATPEAMDCLAGEDFRSGDLSRAQGLIELAAMAFPERRAFWVARWRHVRAEIARRDSRIEA